MRSRTNVIVVRDVTRVNSRRLSGTLAQRPCQPAKRELTKTLQDRLPRTRQGGVDCGRLADPFRTVSGAIEGDDAGPSIRLTAAY